MKKYLFLATAIATASLFTGCSNNEYVGDQPEALNGTDGVIAFSMGKANTTRTGELSREASAGKLNKQFWVYGWKTVAGSASNPQLVFKNYKVEYRIPTTYPSDTEVWEYVGITNPGLSPSQTQTIKYWDYSADKYEFEAYSINGDGTVTRNTNSEYTVDNISQNGCANLYFADKKTVQNAQYNQPVQLAFKSVLSKIRVGFYETIPGYSVKITKFYGPTDTENGTVWATDGDNQKFVAWCPNKKIDDNNNNKSFVVSYNGTTPAVTKVKNITNDEYQPISNNGYILNQSLTLGSNFFLPSNEDKTIGESSSKVTWDNVDNNTSKYTYVIPQNQIELWQDGSRQVQPMKIKVDYTLTSTDGSGEVINVTGATAIVPAEYLRWKPNTAYSYVFKISDQTNGNTGGSSGPAGLYPITFDAVVEDYANEGFTTTVSTPSVTAKQDGATNGYVTTDGIVFQKGKTIDLKVMNGNADVTSGAKITGDYITKAYDYNKTPDQNLTAHSKDITTERSASLPLQKTEGYWVLKVSVTEGEPENQTTSTTYVIIRVGSAEDPANP